MSDEREISLIEPDGIAVWNINSAADSLTQAFGVIRYSVYWVDEAQQLRILLLMVLIIRLELLYAIVGCVVSYPMPAVAFDGPCVATTLRRGVMVELVESPRPRIRSVR